jgi:uncharacterized protein HemX
MTNKFNEDEETNNHNSSTYLEPRVAKLEVGLERLTDDVRSLASIVRDQGQNLEKQLNELTIAVTQAAGPRKTDWSVVISAVLLIMALGSAVFAPLNQTVKENREALILLQNKFELHEKLPNHLVGEALFNRMEEKIKKFEGLEITIKNNNDQLKEIHDKLEKTQK